MSFEPSAFNNSAFTTGAGKIVRIIPRAPRTPLYKRKGK